MARIRNPRPSAAPPGGASRAVPVVRIERGRPGRNLPEPPEPATIPAMWVKRAAAVFLLPLCWIATVALFQVFRAAESQDIWHSPEVWLFSAGFLFWVVVFFLFPRPVGYYVIGHEWTHWLFIRFHGGRIGRVVTTRQGGYVLTDKTNFLITLAPYFVPFWTLVSLVILAVAGLLLDIPWFERLLFLVTGVTWAFHLTFTLSMIGKGQPDIEENGRFFSLTFIYLANLLIITAMLLVASPRVKVAAYWGAVGDESARLARSAAAMVVWDRGK